MEKLEDEHHPRGGNQVLPVELLKYIFSFVSIREFVLLAVVCKSWQSISADMEFVVGTGDILQLIQRNVDQHHPINTIKGSLVRVHASKEAIGNLFFLGEKDASTVAIRNTENESNIWISFHLQPYYLAFIDHISVYLPDWFLQKTRDKEERFIVAASEDGTSWKTLTHYHPKDLVPTLGYVYKSTSFLYYTIPNPDKASGYCNFRLSRTGKDSYSCEQEVFSYFEFYGKLVFRKKVWLEYTKIMRP